MNKLKFSIVFVCIRFIFLYFVHPLRLIFAWVCYSCFGVLNQLKSSIRLMSLRPIFLYLFKNLFWDKCCFSVFAYPWPKFPTEIVGLWRILTYFVFQYGFEQILFWCVKYIEALYCFDVPSAYISTMVFCNCHQEIRNFWTMIAENNSCGGVLSHSQSTDFTREFHAGSLFHTIVPKMFHSLSQGVFHGM